MGTGEQFILLVTMCLLQLKTTLQRQIETCPPEQVEESEHAGTCSDVLREDGEEERFVSIRAICGNHYSQ
jgi:hypothetical protein